MIFIIIILIAALIIIPGVRIINQYERGVVQRLGRFRKILDPGLHVIIPYIDTMRSVDVRTTPMDVPKQEVITKDNVTVNVDAVVYFRVIDAKKQFLRPLTMPMPPPLLLRPHYVMLLVTLIWMNYSQNVTKFLARLKKLLMHKPINGELTLKVSNSKILNFLLI